MPPGIGAWAPSFFGRSATIASAVPAIQHYLIVNWEDREIIHYYRSGEGLAKPSIVRDGLLKLDPPGIEIAHADIFRD